nr:MAG TPA: hypothetical protein [Caudoviricetes sp.]
MACNQYWCINVSIAIYSSLYSRLSGLFSLFSLSNLFDVLFAALLVLWIFITY